MVQRLSKTARLFHWAPVSIRAKIHEEGLRINQLNTFRIPSENPDGSFWMAPWICLGESPAQAWAWSGLQPGYEYDLWEVLRRDSDKIKCRRDGGPVILEVRIHNDIDRHRIWRVGSRLA
jgi:hypothetical protein